MDKKQFSEQGITKNRFKEVYQKEKELFKNCFDLDIDNVEEFKILIVGLLLAQKTVIQNLHDQVDHIVNILEEKN